MKSGKFKSGIVVNRMFVGDYLTHNLGHEIINLFQADNGNHYLYLNAYGNFNKTHTGKIGTMLMVKSVGGNVVEVIGMAQDIEAVEGVNLPYEKSRKDQDNNISEQQIKLIQDEKITYGDVPLNEIFNDAEQQTIFVTYKAKAGKVFIPQEGRRIFIQYGKDSAIDIHGRPQDRYVILEGYKFPSTSLKSYIYPDGKGKGENTEERRKDYERIMSEIVLDEELWTTDKEWKVSAANESTRRKANLFDICEIQNDENRLSNALVYFMNQPEYRKLWQDYFISLGASLEGDYTVEREVDARIDDKLYHANKPGGGRIDLLIKDKSNVIVIENKIKSGINSKSSDTEDMNQLDRYVNFIEWKAGLKNDKLKPLYIILTPDYNIPDASKLNKNYIIITYRHLYDYLLKGPHSEAVENDPNFRDYRDTLFHHTLPTPNAYLFYEMIEKFQRRIREKK